MGTQPVAGIPQPAGAPRTEAGGAAGPLVGAGLRHALGVERVEGARRIVAGDLVQPGVHDRVDAGHGDRRLGDVGREDHAAAPARPVTADGTILLLGAEPAEQVDDLRVRHRVRDLAVGPANLGRAGQEAQHAAARAGPHRADRIGY